MSETGRQLTAKFGTRIAALKEKGGDCLSRYYAEVELGKSPNLLVPIEVGHYEKMVLMNLKLKAERWIHKYMKNPDLHPGEIKLILGPYSWPT